MWRVLSLIMWISLLLIAVTFLAYALRGLPFVALCPLIVVWSYIGLRQLQAYFPSFQSHDSSIY
ncbi:hypothetical protein PEL8287_03067 [Roseovarius litorisediminis]|uniref:Uncharacterized protein n=1 Tax=Roseovarius litorisediminis TaxID=1312363 RepID=A0A1Y5TBX3_9RHOB|nr:hypothetical protein [Roseovarius litorisediminis]SLN56933.1 hypothetical protein PEL8287_03067 [Roseovarius litorisediminis]